MKQTIKNVICIIFVAQLIFGAGYLMGQREVNKIAYDTKALANLSDAYAPIDGGR